MTDDEIENFIIDQIENPEPDQIDYMIAALFAEGIRPVPRMTVSQWSDTYRMLSSKASAEDGPWRTSKVPYLREIMDHLSKTSTVRKIIVMKGAQLGFTEMGNNWIGYLMHLNPGPIIMVMPTDSAVKKNSRTRITPMIESTPELAARIAKRGSKDAENTVQEKSFPGGVLFMIGANSPVGLSSTPAGFIYLDEVDRYPPSAGDEGSPIDLAEARAHTFPNKKIYIISTPTIEGESVVASEFVEGDQCYYNVKCLHCGDLFVITFDCLTWTEGKPETVACACPKCGGLHYERHKTILFAEENGAKWVPTATPSDPLTKSYHLSGLYSPSGWLSWEDVVRKWLKIKGDVNREKTFVNTILGETYKIAADVIDFENLYNRREDYGRGTIPEQVYFLTMGADVQPDRIEFEVVGWARGRTSYSIDYRVLVGDTSKPEVWDQLREAINTQYPAADGYLMPISLACVDAGYNTKTVYDFTSTFSRDKVKPIMGRATVKDVMVSPPKTLNINRAGKKIEGAKVWYLGVSLLKSELYGFLKLQAREVDGVETFPDGYCHFPQYDRNYFEMLTAEELRMVKNKKTGFVSYEWVKKRARNEALDCRCYARAAATIIGMDRFQEDTWEKIKLQSRKAKAEKQAAPQVIQKPKRKPGGDFWNR